MNHEIISSRDNQRLKDVRKIRDGKTRQHVFVEGLRLCEEAVRSSIDIESCYYTDEFSASKRGADLLKAVSDRTEGIFRLSTKAIDSIADTNTPQGIVLICRRRSASFTELLSSMRSHDSIPVVIFLSEINNPANLGAIARTAEATGVGGIITSTRSADIFQPKALRASMGATLRMNIVQDVQVPKVVKWAESNGLVISAADGRADHVYTEIDWKKPRLLVFGSEAHGIDHKDTRFIEEAIRIPMKNYVESLNIAVACGILLFEAVRQNQGS
jgi:TrmH family RNA methyltransferase